jgi:hypothetical protein
MQIGDYLAKLGSPSSLFAASALAVLALGVGACGSCVQDSDLTELRSAALVLERTRNKTNLPLNYFTAFSLWPAVPFVTARGNVAERWHITKGWRASTAM